MRRFLPLLAFALFVSGKASAQSCTGLCLQQVQCTGATTSTITGTVFAPNGTDPLPNVTVYIPNAPVDPMTAGVTCPVPGAIPSGSPLVGTTTNTDGTFTLTNVPIGANIPIVMVTGKWRRQITIDTSGGSCVNTPADPSTTRMPRTAAEGDIPKIAIATGAVDAVECVLRKIGIADSEFQNPGGNGRINFYLAEGAKTTQSGSYIGSSTATPSASVLMQNLSTLNAYDVLMLPCEGSDNSSLRQSESPNTTTGELQNLSSFANAGGRIYASHFSYDWLDEALTYGSGVVSWNPGQKAPASDPQNAIVNQTFADGSTLAHWLTLPSINASSTLGQMQISTLKHDTSGVISPTESWLTLNNDPNAGNAVMQFTFNTPVGATTGQCGRILFNEYHVEAASSNGTAFPAECTSTATMTPQEKLLEYMLFNLTSNGGDPTLTPTSADFGQQPIGFTSGAQSFTWTNKSIFSSAVTLLTATGDFAIAGGNPCTAVAPGASCSIPVVFTPTALGARTGVLTVGGGGKTLTAALTGTGVPGLTISTTSLTFGSVDVSASASQTFLLSNAATGPIPVPALSASGDFAATGANCGSSLPAGASCIVRVTFTPTATGTRTGLLAFNSTYTSAQVALTGNGVDFSVALSPSSGSVISGRSVSFNFSATSIAGYASAVTVTCSSPTPGTTCTVNSSSLVPATGATDGVTITTTSEYTIVGYGGLGGGSLLALLAAGSVWFLRRKGRRSLSLLHMGLAVLLLSAAGLSLTGCGNLNPAQRSVYTAPGSYPVTLTATDGTLTHSATYTLGVTAQ